MVLLGIPVCALMVTFTWLALFLTGVWRSTPSWIDRFGRALGVSWILLFCLQVAGLRP